jgi:hypothetical protein
VILRFLVDSTIVILVGRIFAAKGCSLMRFKLSLFCLVLAGAVACSDAVGPNTDVGLSVWTEVEPSSVSIRDTAAVLRIRVYVANPSFVEIRVKGGPPYGGGWDPSTSQGLWGSVRIANDSSEFNAGPNVGWWGQPVYIFRPRSRQYSEMLVSLQKDWKAGGWPLVPGRYRARGWMNTREGRSAEFVLTQ